MSIMVAVARCKIEHKGLALGTLATRALTFLTSSIKYAASGGLGLVREMTPLS